MKASDKFRKENPGRKLEGLTMVDEIKVGDYTYIEGVVEKIRETKASRFITFYDGAAGEIRREKKFSRGQTMWAV